MVVKSKKYKLLSGGKERKAISEKEESKSNIRLNLKSICCVLVLVFTLFGCSSNKNEVYYKEPSDVLDFGILSGTVPEIIEEESDGSVTYIYHLGKDADKSDLEKFNKNLDKKGYDRVVERSLGDNGLIINIYQNDRYQVMTGEKFDGIDVSIVLISIRERYYKYTAFPSVPDYGAMNNMEPSKASTELDDKGKDVTVYIYRESTKASEYEAVLVSHGFSIIEEKMAYNEGYMTVYSNEEYYVIVGSFPTLTMVTVGSV